MRRGQQAALDAPPAYRLIALTSVGAAAQLSEQMHDFCASTIPRFMPGVALAYTHCTHSFLTICDLIPFHERPGPGLPATLPALPVRLVRTVPRKRDGIPRAQGGREGYREGHAVVLRRLLHAQAQHPQPEGGPGVDSQGAVHHRGLLRGAVRCAHGQQEEGAWGGGTEPLRAMHLCNPIL